MSDDSSKTETWRALISEEMERKGESWDDVVHLAISSDHPTCEWDRGRRVADLDARFDGGFGSSEGAFFTLWTASRVYFPVVYDGAESCASVPRHPCTEATVHVGGE